MIYIILTKMFDLRIAYANWTKLVIPKTQKKRLGL